MQREHPSWTQQQIADEVECDKAYVSRVLTKKSESDNLVKAPPTLQSRTDKADFRKLPVELQQKVAAKEVSLNAAAITKEQARKAVVTEAKANKDKQKRGPKPKRDNSTNFVEIGSSNKNENILRRLARDQPGADNHGNVSMKFDPMPKRDAIGARVGVSSSHYATTGRS